MSTRFLQKHEPEQPPLEEASRAQRGVAARVVSWVLGLAGLAWIVWLLLQERDVLLEKIAAANFGWLLISLLLGASSMIPKVFVFRDFLNKQSQKKMSWIYASKLLFVSQIVHHLPGRFWGVIYQANAARKHISPVAIVKVNIDFTVAFLLFTFVIPLSIITFHRVGTFAASTVFVCGSMLFALSMRFDWVRKLLTVLQRFLPRRVALSLHPYLMVQNGSYCWQAILRVWLLLLTSWVLYLAAWCSFGEVFPSLCRVNLLYVCSMYSISWLAGFLSMIAPAGLGVREAVFVFFTDALASPGSMAFLAVFARFWLLVIDVLLFLLVLPLKCRHINEE